jgi:antitoxin Phd
VRRWVVARVSVSDAREGLPELVNRVAYGRDRVVIERRGQPKAALVSMEDLARLERLEDEEDLAAANKALEEPGERIPLEDVLKSLGV